MFGGELFVSSLFSVVSAVLVNITLLPQQPLHEVADGLAGPVSCAFLLPLPVLQESSRQLSTHHLVAHLILLVPANPIEAALGMALQ